MSGISNFLQDQKEQFRRAFRNPLTYLFLAGFVFLYIYAFQESAELEEHGEFTVGKVIEYGRSGYSGKYVRFRYEVDGVDYTNGMGVDPSDRLIDCEETGWCIGKKYKVRYLTKDPENSRIYLNKPVKDTMQKRK